VTLFDKYSHYPEHIQDSCMVLASKHIVKRKFKHWWSTIPPISTKRTTNCYLK